MPSLYNLIQKSAPNCHLHHNTQALYYNPQSLQFACQNCIHQKDNSHSQNSSIQSQSNQTTFFTLQDIVENPILLMLKQIPFLSKIDSNLNQYHVKEYMKILTDIDFLIKTKKSTQQFTKQFFTQFKLQINNRIDSILVKAEQNTKIIQEIQQKAAYLKRVKKDYSNQFLETLETIYVNGTTEELMEMLKRFSFQNQNPFRKIEQTVIDITNKLSAFTQVNWEHTLQLETKLLDSYAWSLQKVFLLPPQQKLLAKKEYNAILPNSTPHLLGFLKQDEEQMLNDQNYSSEEKTQQKQADKKVYASCTIDQIQLLAILKNEDNQNEFSLIDRLECRSSCIDMMYELPQKMLLTVSYQSLKFFTYQCGKIKSLSEITTIKGCSEVLIFDHFCLILTECDIFQVNYFQLQRPVKLDFKIQDDEVVTEIYYLYREQKKVQSEVLLKVQNRDNSFTRLLKLKLF